MKESAARSLREGSELRLKMAETMSAEIAAAAAAIAEAFKRGRKLLLFGNGGSAADAHAATRSARLMPDRSIELATRSKTSL